MVERIWPAGIGPSGRGLRIKIYKKGKCVHSETVPGDPYSKSHIAATKRRQDELKARLRLGLPLKQADEEATHYLFKDAAQEYLNGLEVKASVSIEYEKALNATWMPSLANRFLTDITEREIRAILGSRRITGKTKKNLLTPLKGVFKNAGIIPTPADKITIKKQQKSHINRYRPDEREKVLAKLEGDAKVYFALLFGCGLRPSEALALTFDHWDGQRLRIEQVIVRRELVDSTKTNYARLVYVPTWVRSLINNLPSRFKDSYLFLDQLGSFRKSPKIFVKAWREAHKAARVTLRTSYVCRHTRAAEMLSAGVSPAKAASQLGHSLDMFLNIYSEFIDEFCSQDDSLLEGVGISTQPKKTPFSG